MSLPVTVVIPTLPSRSVLLRAAIGSVRRQTVTPDGLTVKADRGGVGPGRLRQDMTVEARTPWVAFLDDDDWFMPGHLAALWVAAREARADYVFSWYHVAGGLDPRAGEFGKPWDPAVPRQTTVTILVRRDLVLDTGGFLPGPDAPAGPDGGRAGEDWLFTARANAAGAVIHHLPERTWFWRHWSRPDGTVGNTSGLPVRAAPAEDPGWFTGHTAAHACRA